MCRCCLVVAHGVGLVIVIVFLFSLIIVSFGVGALVVSVCCRRGFVVLALGVAICSLQFAACGSRSVAYQFEKPMPGKLWVSRTTYKENPLGPINPHRAVCAPKAC